jgi:hypothetical protein
VAKEYPSVRLVYGDLDSSDLITEESAKADIVCAWADADSESAAKAVVAGLSRKPADAPGYLIHTSGTGILCFSDLEDGTFGVAREKVYDDWDGIGEVTSLKPSAPHRNVDIIVLSAGTEHADKIKTAIVCPPCIYGPGRGPGNQRSMQLYDMSKITLQRGVGLQVEAAENVWSTVHVQDLSLIFLRLVEDAAASSGVATWGAKGYYFAENGEIVWREMAKKIAEDAKKQGLIETDEVKAVSPDTANELLPWGAFMWGTNSRSRAIRARKLLGWNPVQKSAIDEAADIVAGEAKALGLTKGHAAKAAGQA